MNENKTEILSNINKNIRDIEHSYSSDPIFLISLVVNILLLLTTGLSEIMASSQCKYNSLWQLIISPLYNKLKNKDDESIEETIEENIDEISVLADV